MSEVNKHTNIEHKLESLEAYLVAQEQDINEALDKLSNKADPDSIRRRLSLLLEAEKVEDAAELVKGKYPHERWCDKAVSALVRNDDIAEARKIIEWTKSLGNINYRDRCCIFYAEARYVNTWRGRKLNEVITPTSLTKEEKDDLIDALSVIKPIVERAKANEKIRSELESVALQISMKIQYLLTNYLELRNIANLLLKRKPIPLELIQFALNRLFDIPQDMPERLQKEHPDSFKAKTSAAMIEGEIIGNYEAAFGSAKSLVSEAKSEEERRDLCKILFHLAQALGTGKVSEVKQIAVSLLGKNDHFVRLLDASELLEKDKASEAERILKKIENQDDPNWLQLYAHCLYKNKNINSSVDYMIRASKILPHPQILKTTARLAFDYQRPDIAVQALEQAIVLEPDNVSILHNLAMVHTQMGNFDKAAECFDKLRRLEPTELTNEINFANSLARSGKIEESIRVYNSICNVKEPPLEALISKAQLLKATNEPVQAFDSLIKFRQTFWDEPAYVNALMAISYASQNDTVGHEAFQQLQKLQEKGIAGQDVLFPVSLDQLKEHALRWREHTETIHKNTAQGKCPWLMADQLLGHTSYIGWTIRTQELTWYRDDPITRASWSIYSTNSFHSRKDRDNKIKLIELQCPPRGAEIVVDLTSLITLHRLGLVEELFDYFDKVFVPSTYNENFLLESDRLVFHQLSYVNATRNIKTALDMSKISAIDDAGTPNKRPMPYINEHTLPEKEEEHYYRIKDLAKILYDSGKISNQQNEEIAKVGHKPYGVNDKHPELSLSQNILIDLSTLRTLSNVDALKPVVDCFDVHITQVDNKTLVTEMFQIEQQDNIRKWHKELWDIIKGDKKSCKFSLGEVAQKDKETDSDIALASVVLAQKLEKPLFVDDRVCQVLVLNESALDNRVAAFGTDKFLIALYEAGIINIEQMAEYLLTMMRWRYRFIVPSAAALKALAIQFKEHPPGSKLREVALYLHDCMRDHGLFAGFEKTDQPEAMASKLFITWILIVTEFLMDVWEDQSFSEENAEALTEWTINELLPSPPRNMELRGYAMSNLCPRALYGQAVLKAAIMEDYTRANKALQVIAKTLDMNEKEYLKAITEVLDVC